MKTVFVLGAGVSHSYNYPLGTQLVEKIKLSLDKKDFDSIKFLNDLEAINPYSVDSFIRDRGEHATLAKNLIVEILLSLEENRSFSEVSTNADFYRFLYDQYRNHGFHDFKVVSFNYDRSLEHYFSRAISSQKKISLADAHKELSKFEITHIYGRLPYLEGEIMPENGLRLPYDNFRTSAFYRALRAIRSDNPIEVMRAQETLIPFRQHANKEIKTIHELNEKNEKASALMEDADRIIFLGFGYHDLNMKVLGFDFSREYSQKVIVGTALGMGQVEKRRIRSKYPAISFLADCDCIQFFQNHVSLTDPDLSSWE